MDSSPHPSNSRDSIIALELSKKTALLETLECNTHPPSLEVRACMTQGKYSLSLGLDPSEPGKSFISRELSIRVMMLSVWVAANGNLWFSWFCLSPAQLGHSWPSLTRTGYSLHLATPKTHLVHKSLCRSSCSSLALRTSSVTMVTSLLLPSSISTEFCEGT